MDHMASSGLSSPLLAVCGLCTVWFIWWKRPFSLIWTFVKLKWDWLNCMRTTRDLFFLPFVDCKFHPFFCWNWLSFYIPVNGRGHFVSVSCYGVGGVWLIECFCLFAIFAHFSLSRSFILSSVSCPPYLSLPFATDHLHLEPSYLSILNSKSVILKFSIPT